MRHTLKLAVSPCPNDTFVFHQLALSDDVDLSFDDVEALNGSAERGEADVVKISVAAFPRFQDGYALLRAGGAAGYGVGPLVVARETRPVGGRVAIPGERTTAALLLRLLGRFDTVTLRFDEIEGAVTAGRADCGVLIHEGRFTYAAHGLVALADLGTVWEERMHAPVALGAIAIRRALGPEVARAIDVRLRGSVVSARRQPDASAAFVLEHAPGMPLDVVRRHIDLYVNDYTEEMDESAVRKLLDFGAAEGVLPPLTQPLFAY